MCVIHSGSVQTLGVSGFDGATCTGTAGFSDDEVSLSPPRHSYILELGPRHQAYHTTTHSDDELAALASSSEDTTGVISRGLCNHEPHEAHYYQLASRRSRSCSQGRYRYHSHPHYYPDAL